MTDQASDLRNLIRTGDRCGSDGETNAHMLVVCGGKSGVGTTTLASNMAIALAKAGRQVVLVDADLSQSGVCEACGIASRGAMADVLLDDKDPDTLLQDGPAGLRILSGWSARRHMPLLSGSEESRLASKLRQLGNRFDDIVVDAGNGVRSLTRCLWKSADHVLMVTTPDAVALMDSYAAIKTMRDSREATPISALLNQASSPMAGDAYTRLLAACDRFLGQSIGFAGNIPLDTMLAVAAQMHVPFVMQAPTASATHAIQTVLTKLRNEPHESQLDVAS